MMAFEYSIYDGVFRVSSENEENDLSSGEQADKTSTSEESSKYLSEEPELKVSEDLNDNDDYDEERKQNYAGIFKSVSLKPPLMMRSKFNLNQNNNANENNGFRNEISFASNESTSSSATSGGDAEESNYTNIMRDQIYCSSNLQNDMNLKFATEHSLKIASEELIKNTYKTIFAEDTNLSPVNWRKFGNGRNGNEHIYETIKSKPGISTNDCYRKLESVLDELITSEKKYIQSLDYIIKNYLPEMSSPNVPVQLRGKTAYLFANIESIYEFHRNVFYPALENTITDFQAVARVFINCKEDLYMYAWYTMNSFRSSQLMMLHGQYFQKKRNEIDDKLGLANHLLIPSQRLVQYCKLSSRMSTIVKQLNQNEKKGTDIQASVDVVVRAETVLRELKTVAIDAQLVPFIYNCPLDLSTSRILISGKLVVNNNKRIKSQIFLFDKMVIITERQVKDSLDKFLYRSHIMLCEMKAPVKIFHSDTEFVITNYKGEFKQVRLKAANAEERNRWCDKIMDLLQQEFNKIKQMVDSRKFWKTNLDVINCTINLQEQGLALKCGKLTIKKRSTIHIGNVMLYEKILIFTKVVNNHFSSILVYDDAIKTKYLQLCNHPEYHEDQFCVSCRNTNKSFILQAKSPEEKSAWTKCILDIINKINNTCISIINPT